MSVLNQKWIDELIALDKEKRVCDILDRKLATFKAKFEVGGDFEIVYELIFCLLTAQTKFYSAHKVVSTLMYDENFIFRFLSDSDDDLEKYLSPILRQNLIRFHNNKSRNIVYARNLFIDGERLKIREVLGDFSDVFEMRNWLIDNVLGLSYKESSHFLRNIGFGKKFAILDRHILRIMQWIGIIDELPKSLNKNIYLEYEKKLLDFSNFLGIEMDRLDFLLFVLSKNHFEKSEVDIFRLLEDLK